MLSLPRRRKGQMRLKTGDDLAAPFAALSNELCTILNTPTPANSGQGAIGGLLSKNKTR
jgi:hypothetical protein